MVREKSLLHLHLELVPEQQKREVVSKKDKKEILGIPANLLLMLQYSYFTFSLMKRVVTAGTLIAKEELRWFFTKS